MSAMCHGSDRIEEIYPRECLELLATEQVGRIGVVVMGRPEIFPVNYSLDASNSVILRSGLGTKLSAATNHHVVFEVDRFDVAMESGWSVVVHGVAHQTGGVREGPRPLTPWLQPALYLLRIAHTAISGRRVGPVNSEVATTPVREGSLRVLSGLPARGDGTFDPVDPATPMER
jgi:uncharacterized protein